MIIQILLQAAAITLPSPASLPAEVPQEISPLNWGDYPSWAARHNVGGKVGMELTADPTGRVSSCRVKSSSGNAILDTLTCQLYISKVIYVPSESVRRFETSISWVLPDMEPFDPLETFHLRSLRRLGAQQLTHAWQGPKLTNCSDLAEIRACDWPGGDASDFRQDIPAAANMQIFIRVSDNSMLGIVLKKGTIPAAQFEQDIRGLWGRPCYTDQVSGVTGWIAGKGYVVSTPDRVEIGGQSLDSMTRKVAMACPPLSQ